VIVTRALLTCGLSRIHPLFDRVYNPIQVPSEHSLLFPAESAAAAALIREDRTYG
jgi:hypothetical protein